MKSKTRRIAIYTGHLLHTKEDHLLQEDIGIWMEKLKFFQRTHLNGNLELIILSLRMIMGLLSIENFKFLIKSFNTIYHIIYCSIEIISALRGIRLLRQKMQFLSLVESIMGNELPNTRTENGQV